ncbi:DUF4038 domain-containing protein [Candidatus Poribacteria bacterium]
MRNMGLELVTALSIGLLSASTSGADIHVWERVEITLQAENPYSNPYKDVEVWIQLKGPNFDKKVYGFWDGGNTFKVRAMATAPGEWSWSSHSNQNDAGLNEKNGNFTAVDWSETEKQVNPNRRGTIRPTPNGHALTYADSTPFFLLADTHWAASTWRFPFKGQEPDPNYQPGPGIGFEEMISHLERNGYNSVGFIASYPNWADDEYPRSVKDENGVQLRAAWGKSGSRSAKDMHDENGERPFVTPGKAPGYPDVCADFDRINPAYFQSLDRKMDYLCEKGFVPYVESVRRDHLPSWIRYHDFDESLARYLSYLAARYSTHNWVFALIHSDVVREQVELDKALNYYYHKYGMMPFSQPTTAMAAQSTLEFFGHSDRSPWLKLHASGNWERDHRMYAKIEKQFSHADPIPSFNNEPYYVSLPYDFNDVDGERPEPNSDRDNYFSRAQMYGSVLSGALAGHVYGTGAYAGNTTGEPPAVEPYIWEALKFTAGAQLRYLAKFIMSEGIDYQSLTLASDDLNPRRTPGASPSGLEGWVYMMRTTDRTLALLYFEQGCDRVTVSNMKPETEYRGQWFNPRTGEWTDSGLLKTDGRGTIQLPSFPGTQGKSTTDWALKLKTSG